MAKFVIECPSCGRYAEAKTGFFARKKVECSCGYTIDIRTDKLTSRVCTHCGNDVVFDQSKGAKAKCPVCGEPINTMAEQDKTVEFSCKQCGVRLHTVKGVANYTCPVCDHVNDVAERLKTEQIRKDGLASIIKYEGDNDTLVWKHPIEDFNTGSQLIVHESQEAIFFRDGQALDLFSAGRYTLETQQLPLLDKAYQLPTNTEGTFHSEVYFFNLTHQMALKWGTSERVIMREPQTGAPFSLAARGILNFRIANSRKLMLKLVGTTGSLSRQDLISEGDAPIKTYFREQIKLVVSTNLANIIAKENYDVLLLDQQKMSLSEAMLSALQSSFEAYGLVITEFLITSVLLPKEGDIGYDTLQTLMEIQKTTLGKSAINAKAELELAELDAKNRMDIRIQENIAAVELARRNALRQKGENDLIEAEYSGKRKVVEATGEVEAERLRMLLEMERKQRQAEIEAEELRLKGISQKDILQHEVQKVYGESLGQLGANGGSAAGILGEMAGLGMTMGAMGSVIGMTKDAVAPMMNMGTPAATPAAPVADTWDCACGAKGITAKFCGECGAKKPEPKAVDTWDCPQCGNKGITAKFCGECGCKRPEPPVAWDCPQCGNKGITAKFCGECGCKRPEPPAVWDCPQCGNKGITAKFCGECGYKRGE